MTEVGEVLMARLSRLWPSPPPGTTQANTVNTEAGTQTVATTGSTGNIQPHTPASTQSDTLPLTNQVWCLFVIMLCSVWQATQVT